jgi:hypothetical protein
MPIGLSARSGGCWRRRRGRTVLDTRGREGACVPVHHAGDRSRRRTNAGIRSGRGRLSILVRPAACRGFHAVRTPGRSRSRMRSRRSEWPTCSRPPAVSARCRHPRARCRTCAGRVEVARRSSTEAQLHVAPLVELERLRKIGRQLGARDALRVGAMRRGRPGPSARVWGKETQSQGGVGWDPHVLVSSDGRDRHIKDRPAAGSNGSTQHGWRGMQP